MYKNTRESVISIKGDQWIIKRFKEDADRGKEDFSLAAKKLFAANQHPYKLISSFD